jgi:hypothetical protein
MFRVKHCDGRIRTVDSTRMVLHSNNDCSSERLTSQGAKANALVDGCHKVWVDGVVALLNRGRTSLDLFTLIALHLPVTCHSGAAKVASPLLSQQVLHK